MSIENTYILAVDLGTSGCKTALVSAAGQIVAWEFEAVTMHLLPHGGAEQNPEDWWQAFLTTARRLLHKNTIPTSQIAAVCCSTQGEGTVAVDQNGQPLMNAILWMDMRGAPHLDQITKGPINVAGYDLFKLVRWVNVTGGAPALSGKDPAAHMLLIRDAFPEVYAKTYKFLNVLDFMNLRLSGRFVATPDSILTCWVTDNRDPAHVHYDQNLLKACGIDPAKFPQIVACDEVIGPLLPAVAAELGLATSTKVVAGSIDVTASGIGSGALEDYASHLYIGTSSWIAAHVPFKKTDVLRSIASVPCALPDRYLMIIQQSTAGGNLNFLRDKVLYHKDELIQEAHVPDVYKIMDQIALRVPAGSRGLIYTPWIYGERAPIEDRHVRAGLFNLSLNNSREDIIRAFLEGVAYNARWVLKPAEEFLGRKVTQLSLVGGGATSDVWCQIFADVLGLPIIQAKDAIQVNARGSAFIAAVGLGLLKYSDISQLIEIKARYEPNPANREVYNHTFQEFGNIYNAMKGIYKRLNP